MNFFQQGKSIGLGLAKLHEQSFLKVGNKFRKEGFRLPPANFVNKPIKKVRTTNFKPISDEEETFALRYNKELEDIKMALDKVMLENTDLKYTLENQKLNIISTGGMFVVERTDQAPYRLLFLTPVSDEKTFSFLCEVDNHNFRGLLTRDLMRNIYGMFDL
eukprot:snap_masked-scaffold_5-processed-gene-3.7-mRNA-1 protein AED:1.00 eAED:1.00 QI:0/0/0/0/1/1/2/0/160